MPEKKFKLITLLGIRPDIIRMFKLIKLLDENQNKYGYTHIYAHTGQHYDQELDGIFYEQLGVRRPQINLGVGLAVKSAGGPTSFEYQTGILFPKVLELINREKPDVIMYLGDTNSVLSSIVAARNNIPVIHLEAGGRSYDWRMPEEKCRIVIDHMSDALYAYMPRYKEMLLSEGIEDFRIKVIGNIIYDAVEEFLPMADKTKIIQEHGLEAGDYALVTLHREENTSDLNKLKEKVGGLIKLAKEVTVIWPLMPRVRSNLEKINLLSEAEDAGIKITKPLGYFEFLKLQKEARLIISDSGTVQEEALILGVPALISRLSTERPETIQAGATILSDGDIYEGAKKALDLERDWNRYALNPSKQSPSQLVFEDLMEKISSGFFEKSRLKKNLTANKFINEAYGIF